MLPLISVIIPVYNTQDYVRRCIESVLNNTYRNLEVICVDDGSTDDSLPLLMEIAESDLRVKCFTQKNAGPSATRNRGLREASGEFIAFVDSDDWLHPSYFEMLMQGYRCCQADIIVCESNKTSCYEDNFLPITFSPKDIKTLNGYQALMDFEIRSHIWGRVYKRTLLDNMSFIHSLRLGEDAVFNANIFCKYKDIKISVLSMQLYYYYQRPDSLVHSLANRECIHYGQQYIQLVDGLKDSDLRQALLLLGFRTILASRYVSMFDEDARQFKKYCNIHLWDCMRAMKENGSLSSKTLLECRILAAWPIVYRIYRIMGDRSLLGWEKHQRELKRNRKIIGKLV